MNWLLLIYVMVFLVITACLYFSYSVGLQDGWAEGTNATAVCGVDYAVN